MRKNQPSICFKIYTIPHVKIKGSSNLKEKISGKTPKFFSTIKTSNTYLYGFGGA
jgi:hypothetical protein